MLETLPCEGHVASVANTAAGQDALDHWDNTSPDAATDGASHSLGALTGARYPRVSSDAKFKQGINDWSSIYLSVFNWCYCRIKHIPKEVYAISNNELCYGLSTMHNEPQIRLVKKASSPSVIEYVQW